MRADTAQLDFTGGMNLFIPDHLLSESEYGLAKNIRTDDNRVSCVLGPVIEDAPIGKKQALFGYDRFVVAVISGLVFYKDTDNLSNPWVPIGGGVLDASVDRVWYQAIPYTSTSYGRKLQTDGIINGTSSDHRVDQTSDLIISGISAGVVLQDGKSQPLIIKIQNNAPIVVPTQKYKDWTIYYREYVPIGKQMCFHRGILFVVSPDGKEIYRSVSGRPLDFVVNVNVKGEKGGDATTTAFSTSENVVTSIIGLPNGNLFVGTIDGCQEVELDYEFTIFQEPRFKLAARYDVGIINQNSICKLSGGDYGFIDLDGVRSLQSVVALGNEGREAAMPQKVLPLLDGVKQVDSTSAAFSFNNFAFFSVNTSTEGHVVLVWDILRSVWIGADSYGIGAIKQFAATKQSVSPTLFGMTDTTIYRLFGSAFPLRATFNPKSTVSSNGNDEQTLKEVFCMFQGSASTDELIQVTEVADDVVRSGINQHAKSGGIDVQKFNFEGLSTAAFKVRFSLTWQSLAKLMQWHMITDVRKVENPLSQKVQQR